MPNPAILLCTALVASMIHRFEAIPPLSELGTSLLINGIEFILHPVRSIQLLFLQELDNILSFKYRNDAHFARGTRELFANLISTARAIRQEVQNKDALVISAIGSDLEKNEAADCKEMYLMWRKIGIELWDSYIKCHADGMSNATTYEEIIRGTEHVTRGVEKYRNMLVNCINMDEFVLSYGPIVCTLRVQVELAFFGIAAHYNLIDYLQASVDLENLSEQISSHEGCVNTTQMSDFRKRAKTIMFETKNCLDRMTANATAA